MSRALDPRRVEVLDELTAAMYRRMSGMERLRVAFGAQYFASRIIEARVKREHPDWTDDQVYSEVSRRLLGAHR